MMNDSLCNAEKMWRLGSHSDGMPLMQKQNMLLSKQKAETRVFQSSECVWPNGRCVKDFKGADESKSTLTSEAGKCFIGKENRSFSK